MLILMLFAPQFNIIFAISTSNNPIINKIYARERWRTSAWYLPEFEQPKVCYLLAALFIKHEGRFYWKMGHDSGYLFDHIVVKYLCLLISR